MLQVVTYNVCSSFEPNLQNTGVILYEIIKKVKIMINIENSLSHCEYLSKHKIARIFSKKFSPI